MSGALASMDAGLAPELAGGLLVRGIAAVFLVAFLSLRGQILGLAGSRGITPVRDVLARIRADYPTPLRFFWFPTLLHVRSDDRFLALLPDAGALAAMLVTVGGPWAVPCLLLCWALYLSLDVAADLLYPWDCILLEAGFLALFLPAPRLLPDLALAAAPAPAVVWAMKWLLFRVLVGFGKLKFFSPGRLHADYLKSFLISQPLSTPLAWLAHRLPRPVHALGLGLLFLVELVFPFLLFAPWPWPLVPFTGTVALMAVIVLHGNFGFFNLAVAVLSLVCLDGTWSVASVFRDPSSAGVPGLVAGVALLGGLVSLPFNSWVTRAWPFWPGIAAHRNPLVRAAAAFARWLGALRLVHAYGVFSRESGPPAKWSIVIEGTRDGVTWRKYRYRYMPVDERSPPRFIAPHHPRLDHLIFYEALGLGHHNLFGSTVGLGNPYRFCRRGFAERLLERLLEQSPEVLALMGEDPFPEGPPAQIRATLYALEPVTLAAWQQTGTYWTVRRVHTQLAARARDPEAWIDWLPRAPELHPDEVVWQRRHLATHAALASACLTDEEELAAALAARPLSLARTGAPADIEAAQAHVRRWGPGLAARVERGLALLALRIVEEWTSRGAPPGARFELWLLALDAVSRGREAAVAAMSSPAPDRDAATCAAALVAWSAFRADMIAQHAKKARFRELTLRSVASDPPAVAPGFLRVMPALSRALPRTADETLPEYVRVPGVGWCVARGADPSSTFGKRIHDERHLDPEGLTG